MSTPLLYKVCMPRLKTPSFIVLWAGAALHLLTVYVAANVSGWISAALSLVFPVAAQVYWILELWQRTGVLVNFLTVACVAYIVAWLVFCLAQCLRPGPVEFPHRE